MSDSHEHHVTGLPVYLSIFTALMVLTALTVWAAFQEFGPLNDVIAMAIAFSKATLVVLFFMHVRHASRLTKVVVVSGFLWFGILVAFTLSDFWTRGFLN